MSRFADQFTLGSELNIFPKFHRTSARSRSPRGASHSSRDQSASFTVPRHVARITCRRARPPRAAARQGWMPCLCPRRRRRPAPGAAACCLAVTGRVLGSRLGSARLPSALGRRWGAATLLMSARAPRPAVPAERPVSELVASRRVAACVDSCRSQGGCRPPAACRGGGQAPHPTTPVVERSPSATRAGAS